MTYLGINLTNCERDLYEENYRILMKEIKKSYSKIFILLFLSINSMIN